MLHRSVETGLLCTEGHGSSSVSTLQCHVATICNWNLRVGCNSGQIYVLPQYCIFLQTGATELVGCGLCDSPGSLPSVLVVSKRRGVLRRGKALPIQVVGQASVLRRIVCKTIYFCLLFRCGCKKHKPMEEQEEDEESETVAEE